MKKSLAAALCALLLLSSACSEATEEPSAESPVPVLTEEPAPEASQPPSESPEQETPEAAENPEEQEFLSVEEAWGDVEITVFPDWHHSTPYAITPSGDMLYTWVGQTDGGSDGSASHALKVMNIYSGEEAVIHELEGDWSFSYACMNDDWIIYTVYSLYNLNLFDEIYIYNRSTGESTLFFTAPEGGVNTPLPSLYGNRMVIDLPDGQGEDGELLVNCYEYDLNTGERTLIAENATNPLYGEDGSIFVLCREEKTGAVRDNYGMIFKLVDGQLQPIMSERLRIFSASCYAGNDSIFLIGNRDNMENANHAYLLEDGQLKTICQGEGLLGDNCDWADASGRMLMWRMGGNAYAYDRVLDCTVRLTYDWTSGFLSTDEFIIWARASESEEDGSSTSELCIIEVADLPVS